MRIFHAIPMTHWNVPSMFALESSGLATKSHVPIWVWINTYRYIFSGMNIHLPAILMFTRGTRF